MTSSMVSMRTWLLTALVLGVVSMSTFAGDGVEQPWYESVEPCTSCSDGSNGRACGACFNGLDDYACGDMTPTAMLPGGQWYFQADFMAIRRQTGQNDVFQTRNTNTLTVTEVLDAAGNSLPTPQYELVSTITRDDVLSTNSLDFQNAAGYRLLFGWQLAENYAVEFSYFDLNDWDEFDAVSDATEYLVSATIDPDTGVVSAPVTQSNSLFSPFTNFGDPAYPEDMIEDFDYNELASVHYQSSLDNVELNVRHRIKTDPSRLAMSVLWGGRHNAIREYMNYYSLSPVNAIATAATTNSAQTWTKNDLWGAQVGAQFDFCWDPGWHTEFEIKGGVAHNRAVYEGLYNIQNGSGGTLTTNRERVDKDVTSWIGEMRLTMVYQFGAHLTTHIGYEALMLSRVALASGNFETDLSILADPNQWVLRNNGTAIYHGPSAGFTFAW